MSKPSIKISQPSVVKNTLPLFCEDGTHLWLKEEMSKPVDTKILTLNINLTVIASDYERKNIVGEYEIFISIELISQHQPKKVCEIFFEIIQYVIGAMKSELQKENLVNYPFDGLRGLSFEQTLPALKELFYPIGLQNN